MVSDTQMYKMKPITNFGKQFLFFLIAHYNLSVLISAGERYEGSHTNYQTIRKLRPNRGKKPFSHGTGLHNHGTLSAAGYPNSLTNSNLGESGVHIVNQGGDPINIQITGDNATPEDILISSTLNSYMQDVPNSTTEIKDSGGPLLNMSTNNKPKPSTSTLSIVGATIANVSSNLSEAVGLTAETLEMDAFEIFPDSKRGLGIPNNALGSTLSVDELEFLSEQSENISLQATGQDMLSSLQIQLGSPLELNLLNDIAPGKPTVGRPQSAVLTSGTELNKYQLSNNINVLNGSEITVVLKPSTTILGNVGALPQNANNLSLSTGGSFSGYQVPPRIPAGWSKPPPKRQQPRPE